MVVLVQPTASATMTVSTPVPVVVLCPGHHGHGMARSLGRMGVRVFGVHKDLTSPAARSRYWTHNLQWDFSLATAQESIDWLLQLAARVGNRPLLIPTDDGSCLFVSDHADALCAAFRFPNQSTGLARRLSSKKLMYLLCREFGMPTAATSFPQSRAEVEAYAPNATFPVMLKGIDTLALQQRTGVKMVVAHDADDLLRRYDELNDPTGEPNLMLQEYLPGGSQTLWMFDGYFDEHSDCLFGMTGQKIREYPAYTGRTSLGVCRANETVTRQTMAFMKAIGYRGALDLDYKYDLRTGEYKLIDVNPRVGTTFRLFVDSMGMDVVRALYLDLTGQRVAAGELREGRKWLVENFEAMCVPTYMWRERFGLRGWVNSYRGMEEMCWFARDDPAPFLTLVPQSVRWLATKWLRRTRTHEGQEPR